MNKKVRTGGLRDPLSSNSSVGKGPSSLHHSSSSSFEALPLSNRSIQNNHGGDNGDYYGEELETTTCPYLAAYSPRVHSTVEP